jgi:hypothetical protein
VDRLQQTLATKQGFYAASQLGLGVRDHTSWDFFQAYLE